MPGADPHAADVMFPGIRCQGLYCAENQKCFVIVYQVWQFLSYSDRLKYKPAQIVNLYLKSWVDLYL